MAVPLFPVYEQVNGEARYHEHPALKLTDAERAAGVTPVNYAYPADSPWRDTRRDGAVADNSTDNTVKVQTSLDALAATTSGAGGTVFNPKGSKFDLSALTLPARCALRFYGGDDTSTLGKRYTLDTNEIITLIANANSGGIVNEERLTSTFHPSHNIDARKSLNVHDAYLGSGQSRTAPVRASYNLFDDGQNRGRVLYQNNADEYDISSGFFIHSWVDRITLSGINTGSYAVDPVAGEIVAGAVSGATAFVISCDVTNMVVEWVSGVFQTGEHIIVVRPSSSNETSSTTVSSVSESLLASHALGADFARGNWSIGIPAGSARDVFAVGGKISSAKTRSMGQYVDETINNPGFVWVDSYENSPPHGFEILYDTSPAAASRRLYLTAFDSTAKIAHIGATKAYTTFTNAALVATSAFNVASIVRNGVGDYTITFTTALARADYAVNLGSGNPMEYPTYFVRTTTTIQIKVYTTGTTTLVDITGEVSVLCSGGDI